LFNKSRTWVFIGFIGLIVLGLVLIAAPAFTPVQTPSSLSSFSSTATSSASSDVPYPEVIRVTVDNAHAAQESKQAVFVDVRTTEQYAERHIPGALSMPLSTFEEQLSELNPDQWIITYCS